MARCRRFRKGSLAGLILLVGGGMAIGPALAGGQEAPGLRRTLQPATPECPAGLGDDTYSLARAVELADESATDETISLTEGCHYRLPVALTLDDDAGLVRIEGNGAIVEPEHSAFRVGPGARLTLEHVVVSGSGNSAIANSGTLEVLGVTFVGNTARVYGSSEADGGAIDNHGGNVNVHDSEFSANRATEEGGAIYNEVTVDRVGTLTVAGSTFAGNVAGEGDGGAIYNEGIVKVWRSTFSDNVSRQGDGGAIYSDAGDAPGAVVVNSTFAGNKALAGDGGALFNEGDLSVDSATFYGNESSHTGGGILDDEGGEIVNSLFVANASGWGYGGALASFGPTELEHSAVVGAGPDACFADGASITGGGNLSGPGTPGCGTSRTVDGLDWVRAPADGSGQTETVALEEGNPAIDGGGTRACRDEDQRGRPRPQAEGNPCDIGAWEADRSSGEPPPGPDIDTDDEVENEGSEDGDRHDDDSIESDDPVGPQGPVNRDDDGTYTAVAVSATPAPATSPHAGGAPVPTKPPHDLPTDVEGASPLGEGPDLMLEDVTLEVVDDGVAVGDAGRTVTLAASGESLSVAARVVNQGDAASGPAAIVVSKGEWAGDPVEVPGVPPGAATEVDEVIPAPPDAGGTKFTVTIDNAGDADPTNNAMPDVVAVAAGDTGFPTKTVLVVVVVVLFVGAVVVALAGTTSLFGGSSSVASSASSNAHEGGSNGSTGGLDEMADRYLGHEPGPPLWSAGPMSRRLRDEIADDARVSPLIATACWRALVETPSFRRSLEAAGASPAALERPEILVVSHADATRYDLVVLDPDCTLAEPAGGKIVISPRDLATAWKSLRGDQLATGVLARLPAGMVSSVLEEVCAFVEFGVVVARKPELVPTLCPSPAWAVGFPGAAPTSTAGAAVVDAAGRVGVTVADHAVRGHETVEVDGRRGIVVSSDAISDSSFVTVEVSDGDAVRGARGPLSGMSPRQMEIAEFDGMRSGRRDARIVGWDPTILTTESYIQSKIVTEPVTLPGDSGAALVDGDGHVLGFAFYTTGLDAQPAHSGWIWADSVYRFHGLRPLAPE